MIWAFIMLFTLIIFFLGIIYLISRINKIKVIKKIEKNKFMSYLIPICIFIIFCILLGIFFSFINIIVIIIHLVIFCLIFDFIFHFIKHNYKFYWPGILTIVFTFVYLTIGYYYAHHVYQTNYEIRSDKIAENIKIIQFSDSHLGTTFNSNKFNEYLKEMEKVKPDVILLTGDFVDDGTDKDDMIKACEFLGKIKTKYGIYFSYGNHDKGYYGSSYRGFSKEDLEEEFEKNNIKVLEDESVLINDNFYIIGRKDYEDLERLSIEKLTKDLDKNKYMIVMDHQPTDYENESNSKVDLVLSGHTHGGQLIPLHFLSKVLSDNYRVYGYEKRDKSNFIVSSGISDWELKFKTGCISEYNVIDIIK